MENLELSLSSLGTISRHVDKSHNELSQYLSKQVRHIHSWLVWNKIMCSVLIGVFYFHTVTQNVSCVLYAVTFPSHVSNHCTNYIILVYFLSFKLFCCLVNPCEELLIYMWILCQPINNSIGTFPFSLFHFPQIWSQQDRQCILECVAQLLLEKDYTLLIARHLRPLVLDLLERNAERVKAGGRINHDLHERLCVALSKLLGISPDAQA